MSNKMLEKKAERSASDFVKVWQTSNTTKEVKERLGGAWDKPGLFAGYLRKNGVALKELRRASKYDFPALCKLANKYLSDGRIQKAKTVDTKNK